MVLNRHYMDTLFTDPAGKNPIGTAHLEYYRGHHLDEENHQDRFEKAAMDQSLLIITLVSFGAAGLLTDGVFLYTSSRREIHDRFAKTKDVKPSLIRQDGKSSSLKDRALEAISSFGKMTLGKEKEKPKISDLRLTLIQAGFRYTNAVAVFFGIKAICTVMLPLCYLFYLTWTHKVTGMNLALPWEPRAWGISSPIIF